MALNSPLPELFNYNKGHHHSSSFEEPFDTYTTAFSSLFANSNDCNSSSTDLMMNYAFTPNCLAYSSSSVLNFDQPEYNSSPDQEECNLRRDSTDQNNFNVEEYIVNDSNVKQNKTAQKRQFEGGDEKIDKRQCGKNRKPKAKASDSDSSSPLKDPQSLAAKNRRERISERLKVLQELIPNGTKVDLVTMLEKAVGYVKFLQLQVKVLASDEFWPTQGKKAPNISQVSEALDAILSSQRA